MLSQITKQITNLLLLALSTLIAAVLIVTHRAPWVLIAAYWTVNAVRNLEGVGK